jgi:hypothetical protein
MLEHSVERFFEDMANQEQPQSRVSIQRALQEGRGRLRHRRLARAVGTPVLAASAALAVVFGVALPASRPSHSHTPNVSSGTFVQGAFNPSYLGLKFGWLPADTHPTTGLTTPAQELLATSGPHHGQWSLTANALCHVSTSGRKLDCAGVNPFDEVISGAGPEIDGRASLWLENRTELAWQYGANSWATLQYQVITVTAPPTPSVPAVGLRIARAVKFHQHVTFHYASRFSSRQRGWRIVSVGFQREDGVYLATAYQIAKLRRISPAAEVGVYLALKNEPAIAIVPQTSADYCNIPKWANKGHVTIHGYVFTLAVYGHGGSVPGMLLCGTHEDGLFVQINENGTHLRFTPVDAMKRLQLLGTSSSDWVTNPLP